MIVAYNRCGLDAGTDQKVYQHRLYLGLTRLEVITGDKHIMQLGHFDDARYECVLRRPIDVGALSR